MATPNYKGQGQPAATSGGWLSSVFGGVTPAYKAAPAQPAAPTPSANASTTPSTAANAPSTTGCDADVPTQFAIVIPRQVIETD